MNGRTFLVSMTLVLAGVTVQWAGTDARVSSYRILQRYGAIEPLILDVGADGFALTSAEDGVTFDLDGDGTPDRLGWTDSSGNEAFLAIDATRTGTIEDGRKLLGGLFNGQNGFTTLERLDADPSLLGAEYPARADSRKTDGQIVGGDTVYERLILWRDANHNGVAEGSELRSAASAGLTKLYTGVVGIDRTDEHGNLFRFSSKVLVVNQYGVPVASELRSVRLVR